VRHVPETRLRRLVDEPFAIADAELTHVDGCLRCGLRREQIAEDAAGAVALLSRPQPVPDVDSAWTRLQAAPAPPAQRARLRLRSRRPLAPSGWRRRLVTLSLPATPLRMAIVVVVVVGAIGATALTTVLAPKRAPSAPTSSAGIQALADIVGMDGGSGTLGGFSHSSGSLDLPFGVLSWSSAGVAQPFASIAAASKASGLDLRAPGALPAGVGSPAVILVQPEVTATVRFGATAGPLAGESLTVTAGPAVLVEYGASTTALRLPTLGTFAMRRPRVSSTDSATTRLEAYVLSQPGVPAGLAQEIRLLGDIGTVLPVPTPPGTNVTQVDVGGSPGVLVTDASVGASGVIWEDRGGLVQAAVGLLDRRDIVDVANQLG
jgi:hypothetical protein